MSKKEELDKLELRMNELYKKSLDLRDALLKIELEMNELKMTIKKLKERIYGY